MYVASECIHLWLTICATGNPSRIESMPSSSIPLCTGKAKLLLLRTRCICSGAAAAGATVMRVCVCSCVCMQMSMSISDSAFLVALPCLPSPPLLCSALLSSPHLLFCICCFISVSVFCQPCALSCLPEICNARKSCKHKQTRHIHTHTRTQSHRKWIFVLELEKLLEKT